MLGRGLDYIALIFSSYRGSLLNFGKRYEDDIWVIFDQ